MSERYSIPTTIYLQIGDEGTESLDDMSWSDISWNREKIFDSDIEYRLVRRSIKNRNLKEEPKEKP